MLALEYPRKPKKLRWSEKPLKYYNKNWPKKSPKVEWGEAFDIISFPTLRGSPVGLVHKRDGDFWLIHHLSYPDCDFVYYFIEPDT